MLLLGRKAMAKLDSILKSRDITLPTKVKFAQLSPTLCNPWTIAHQAALSIPQTRMLEWAAIPLSRGSSWSRDQTPALQADSWPSEPPGKLINVHIVKARIFPVVTYGCKSWTIKKAEHQRINAFELWCWRRLENPMDGKTIKPTSSKGNQPWIFIGRADAEAETPVQWPLDAKSQATGKEPWCWERLKGKESVAADDEMFRWHHRLNGHEFEKTAGNGEGQKSRVCCSPWGRKQLDMTKRLNNHTTSLVLVYFITGSSYLLTTFIQFSHPTHHRLPPVTTNLISFLLVCSFVCFWSIIDL